MTIHQLNLPEPEDERLKAFNEFWKWYPHNPTRKKKAAARKKFMDITQPGGVDTRTEDKDSGGYTPLHLEATPEEIVEGVKVFWKSFPAKSGSYERDTQYAPAAEVWLNGGRWED